MKVDSTRERRPSHGFGWVDRRIVSGGYLAAMPQTEAAVYLLLCVVADRHGVSYYHPATLGKLLKHSENRVRAALEALAERDLIATAGRFAQVLDVGLARRAPGQSSEVPGPAEAAACSQPPPRSTTAAGVTPSAAAGPAEPSGAQRLAALCEERREHWRSLARTEFARFMGSRAAGAAVLDALAADMAHRRGEL